MALQRFEQQLGGDAAAVEQRLVDRGQAGVGRDRRDEDDVAGAIFKVSQTAGGASKVMPVAITAQAETPRYRVFFVSARVMICSPEANCAGIRRSAQR